MTGAAENLDSTSVRAAFETFSSPSAPRVMRPYMPFASASTSPGATTTPVTPSTTISLTPPTSVATTGRPAAHDSSTTFGKPSHSEASTKPFDTAMKSLTSLLYPRNVTSSSMPNVVHKVFSSSSSGPLPAISRWQSTPLSFNSAMARRAISWPFWGSRRPTESHNQLGLRPGGNNSALVRPGREGDESTMAFGMTVSRCFRTTPLESSVSAARTELVVVTSSRPAVAIMRNSAKRPPNTSFRIELTTTGTLASLAAMRPRTFA